MDGDVAADVDAVRTEQVTQKTHLHSLFLDVVEDWLFHVLGTVVARVVEPVSLQH